MQKFIVTGRVENDDEDTLLILEAADAKAAWEAFEQHLTQCRIEDDVDMDEYQIYLNHVVRIEGKAEILTDGMYNHADLTKAA